jgi:DNA polymerase III epsilon subunit-like protein
MLHSYTNPTHHFAAFDLETTAKSPQSAHIVEWAVVVFTPNSITAHSSLVDPGVPIPAEASRIHGITDADIVAAPTTKQTLPRLLDLLAAQPLIVTYNGDEYDLAVLAAECRRHGFAMPQLHHIDVYGLAAPTSRLPQHRSGARSLATMAAQHNVPPGRGHRAVDDATATGLLFRRLVEKA